MKTGWLGKGKKNKGNLLKVCVEKKKIKGVRGKSPEFREVCGVLVSAQSGIDRVDGWAMEKIIKKRRKKRENATSWAESGKSGFKIVSGKRANPPS